LIEHPEHLVICTDWPTAPYIGIEQENCVRFYHAQSPVIFAIDFLLMYFWWCNNVSNMCCSRHLNCNCNLHSLHPLSIFLLVCGTHLHAVFRVCRYQIYYVIHRWSVFCCSLFSVYGINSILYQRGIYPPETFTRVQKYGLTILVTTDDELKNYLTNILADVKGRLQVIIVKAQAHNTISAVAM